MCPDVWHKDHYSDILNPSRRSPAGPLLLAHRASVPAELRSNVANELAHVVTDDFKERTADDRHLGRPRPPRRRAHGKTVTLEEWRPSRLRLSHFVQEPSPSPNVEIQAVFQAQCKACGWRGDFHALSDARRERTNHTCPA